MQHSKDIQLKLQVTQIEHSILINGLFFRYNLNSAYHTDGVVMVLSRNDIIQEISKLPDDVAQKRDSLLNTLRSIPESLFSGYLSPDDLIESARYVATPGRGILKSDED